MEVVETIALITINETLIFQLLSFLLFLFIIHRIMIRPLNHAMQERDLLLKRLNGEIVDAGKQYDHICKQIERQEIEIRNEALKIRNEIETTGQQQATEMIARTKEEINAMKTKAQHGCQTGSGPRRSPK